MRRYTGTKEVNATPMTRAAYNEFRGWELPADENGDDEGYLVEYVDGGKANTTQYAGYVSWSPKDVFERAYTPIPIIVEPAGPTVTKASMESQISGEYYFTAYDGVKHGHITRDEPKHSNTLKLLTFCVLVLKNGFKVTGESACVSPENFNEELGRKYAREAAIEKLWPLMGYKLACDLADNGGE